MSCSAASNTPTWVPCSINTLISSSVTGGSSEGLTPSRRMPASVETLNSDTSGEVSRDRKRMGLATEMATFSGSFIASRLGINSPITSVK